MIKKFKRILDYTIVAKVFCDKCNKEMSTTGIIFTTYPAKHEYYCYDCNVGLGVSERELQYEQVYTETEYVEDEEE